MGKLGDFLGWLTGLCFALALLNYLVKWANKRWGAKLPKDSDLKKNYNTFMKFIIKNHRFFGFGAAISLGIHLFLQITFQWVSVTGLIAAGLLILNVLMGAYLFFKLKGTRGKLFKAHRINTILLIAAVAVHVITKL